MTSVTIVLNVPIGRSDRERLARLAETTGRSEEEIAAEAIAGALDANDWQVEAILQAIAEMDRGEGIPHEEVPAWVESLGTAHGLPPPGPRRK